MTRNTAVIFDIDGVLIDSYRGIPVFYRRVLPKLINVPEYEIDRLIHLEMFADAVSLLREDWWSKIDYIKPIYDELLSKYWETRIDHSMLEPCAHHVLKVLHSNGYILGSVSYRDDIIGLKKHRISIFGLSHYFGKDVLVVGEDVESRYEGIMTLIEKHGIEKAYYIDDKPLSLLNIRRKKPNELILVRYVFKRNDIPIYPWEHSYCGDHCIYNLCELLKILET